MKEVYPNLHVGNELDYENAVRDQPGWAVVHACKEPYHRQALGYRTQGAPKTHPEYLIARRGERLILNLVDADNPAYIPKTIVDAALEFVHEQLGANKEVLVHCNQGMSRSATIALLFLVKHTDILPRTMAEAETAFRAIYPPYNPAGGMRGFMTEHWQEYASRDV